MFIRILYSVACGLVLAQFSAAQDRLLLSITTGYQQQYAEMIACESETRSLIGIGIASTDSNIRASAAKAIVSLHRDQLPMSQLLARYVSQESQLHLRDYLLGIVRTVEERHAKTSTSQVREKPLSQAVLNDDLLTLSIVLARQQEIAECVARKSEINSLVIAGLLSTDPKSRNKANSMIRLEIPEAQTGRREMPGEMPHAKCPQLRADRLGWATILRMFAPSEADARVKMMMDLSITQLEREPYYMGEKEIASRLRAMGLQVHIDADGYVSNLSRGPSDLIRDSDIDLILSLKRLRQLSINGSHLTNEGFSRFGALKTLESVNAPQSIGDAGLKWLGDLPNLKFFSGNGISDETLKVLSKSRFLVFFGTTSKNVSDEGMEYLSQLLSLEDLTLPTTITEKGIECLKRLPLRRLAFGSGGSFYMNDETLRHISEIATIEFLKLSLCENVTENGFSRLERNERLNHLSASILPESCFRLLRNFPALKILEITEVRQEHIEHLLACEKLSSISANKSTLTAEQHSSLSKRFKIITRN